MHSSLAHLPLSEHMSKHTVLSPLTSLPRSEFSQTHALTRCHDPSSNLFSQALLGTYIYKPFCVPPVHNTCSRILQNSVLVLYTTSVLLVQTNVSRAMAQFPGIPWDQRPDFLALTQRDDPAGIVTSYSKAPPSIKKTTMLTIAKIPLVRVSLQPMSRPSSLGKPALRLMTVEQS